MSNDEKYLIDTSKPAPVKPKGEQIIQLKQRGDEYVREKDNFEHGIEHMGDGYREWTRNLLSGQIIHDETVVTGVDEKGDGMVITITEPANQTRVGGSIKL